MKKSFGFIDKILTKEKKIESRWYKSKRVPWNNINAGDIIFFKNSGGSVFVKAETEKVVRFSDLTPEKVKEILEEYGNNIGIEKENILGFFKRFKDKKYCLLIFLKNPEKIHPFEIDKKGFGAMAAWISIDDINDIKINLEL